MAYIPSIKLEEGEATASINTINAVFNDRIIFISEMINTEAMTSIVSQLLVLEAKEPNEPIHIYISSPGGSVSDGFAIIDVMKNCSCEIHTYCLGLAASMGALIFLCGDKRYMLENSQIMLHQPLGGVQGQASDIAITAKRILKIKDNINVLISKKTGVDLERVSNDFDRDRWFDSKEALDYGIADKIITNTKE